MGKVAEWEGVETKCDDIGKNSCGDSEEKKNTEVRPKEIVSMVFSEDEEGEWLQDSQRQSRRGGNDSPSPLKKRRAFAHSLHHPPSKSNMPQSHKKVEDIEDIVVARKELATSSYFANHRSSTYVGLPST